MSRTKKSKEKMVLWIRFENVQGMTLFVHESSVVFVDETSS